MGNEDQFCRSSAITPLEPNPLTDSQIMNLIKLNLLKHSSTGEEYNTKVINDIIYDEKKHIVSIFKDYLLIDEVTDFFKRCYSKDESLLRVKKMCDYYYADGSKPLPTYAKLEEQNILLKNIKRKQIVIQLLKEQKEIEEENRANEYSNFLLPEIFSLDNNSALNDSNVKTAQHNTENKTIENAIDIENNNKTNNNAMHHTLDDIEMSLIKPSQITEMSTCTYFAEEENVYMTTSEAPGEYDNHITTEVIQTLESINVSKENCNGRSNPKVNSQNNMKPMKKVILNNKLGFNKKSNFQLKTNLMHKSSNLMKTLITKEKPSTIYEKITHIKNGQKKILTQNIQCNVNLKVKPGYIKSKIFSGSREKTLTNKLKKDSSIYAKRPMYNLNVKVKVNVDKKINHNLSKIIPLMNIDCSLNNRNEGHHFQSPQRINKSTTFSPNRIISPLKNLKVGLSNVFPQSRYKESLSRHFATLINIVPPPKKVPYKQQFQKHISDCNRSPAHKSSFFSTFPSRHQMSLISRLNNSTEKKDTITTVNIACPFDGKARESKDNKPIMVNPMKNKFPISLNLDIKRFLPKINHFFVEKEIMAPKERNTSSERINTKGVNVFSIQNKSMSKPLLAHFPVSTRNLGKK